jgi:hypothetical protein
MPDWNGSPVKPAHLLIKPVTPLRPEPVGVRSEACNLITWKYDELRLWNELAHHRIDGGKGLLVQRAGNAGTGIAVEDELVPSPRGNSAGICSGRFVFEGRSIMVLNYLGCGPNTNRSCRSLTSSVLPPSRL